MAAQVSGDPTFVVGQQGVLFSMAEYLSGLGHPMYDVSTNDRGFVMLRLGDPSVISSELIMVTNWFEELRQRMAN